MAKIDNVLESIETGFNNPVVNAGTSWVEDKDMEKIQVRRRKAGEDRHRLWFLSVAENGQTPQIFWGYKMSDCLKKALAWKGLPTVNKRKPKS